jgi:hypothetical protein
MRQAQRKSLLFLDRERVFQQRGADPFLYLLAQPCYLRVHQHQQLDFLHTRAESIEEAKLDPGESAPGGVRLSLVSGTEVLTLIRLRPSRAGQQAGACPQFPVPAASASSNLLVQVPIRSDLETQHVSAKTVPFLEMEMPQPPRVDPGRRSRGVKSSTSLALTFLAEHPQSNFELLSLVLDTIFGLPGAI